MKNMLLQILSVVCSYGSLLGLYLSIKSDKDFTSSEIFIICIGLLTSYLVIHEAVDYYHSKPKVYNKSNNKGILKFMYKWIKYGGKVAICTRDMSWIDFKMKKLLLSKAEEDELIICLPKK